MRNTSTSTSTNARIGPFELSWNSLSRIILTLGMLVAMFWVLYAQVDELKATMSNVQTSQQEMKEDIVALKTSMRYIEQRVGYRLNPGAGLNPGIPGGGSTAK